jgi:hypothetical protein
LCKYLAIADQVGQKNRRRYRLRFYLAYFSSSECRSFANGLVLAS